MSSEIRKDYLQERYVLIAPGRQQRPHDVERPERLNFHHQACGFCPAAVNAVHAPLTIGPKDRWYVKAIPNIYPAVTIDNPKAYGRQEIIIETPNHLLHLEDLPEEQIEHVFEAYAHRTRAMMQDRQLEYLLLFKNNGGRAGATLEHAHSQVFATSFLPPNILDRSQRAQAHRLQHGTCAYCEIINKERTDARLVYEDDLVIAFTPYASFFNYEVWLMPKRHFDNVTQVTAEERARFAFVLKRLLRAISDLHLPYNFYFHQVMRDRDQHFLIEIAPRGSVWAGVELGSGLIINQVAPEQAAAHYRNTLNLR